MAQVAWQCGGKTQGEMPQMAFVAQGRRRILLQLTSFLIALCISGVAQGGPVDRSKEVRFEVLSVRPVKAQLVYTEHFSMTTDPLPNGFESRLSVWQMIMLAYGSCNDKDWASVEMRKSPAWIGDFYDIKGRVSQADLRTWQNQSREHELLRSAMRAALKDRFKLLLHEEPSKGEAFELIVGRRGPKLKAAAPHAVFPSGQKLKSGGVMVPISTPGGGQGWAFYGATIPDLADFLHILAGGGRTPVRDETGLAGHYDFSIHQVPPVPDEDHIYTYPIDHLGLRVRHTTEPRPILIVDHIEKPSAN